MESKSYVCVKCGRVCHYCLHGKYEADEQLCSQCYSEAHTQKEPFNFEHPEPISPDAFGSMNEVPDDVQKTAPKHVPSLTDLIRDEARKRAMRNECNGIGKKEPKPVSDMDMFTEGQNNLRSLRGEVNSVYKRSADVEVPACAICAQHLDGSRSLKTATGQVICESCHYRLYHEEPAKPLQSYIEERYDAIPQEALRAIARVMGHGTRKYGTKNWDKISTEDHVNHALRHINLALLDDTEDEPGTKAHLSHAITRLMFAYETYKEVSE